MVRAVGIVAGRAALDLRVGVCRFEKAGTCIKCHETVGREVAVAHEPMADDVSRSRASGATCAACHKPHGLIGALRLQQPEPELCFSCHDAGDLGTEAAHTHPELESCSTCHDPHGSNHSAILRTSEVDLCLDCHSGPSFEQKIQHSPAALDCVSCHLPHGGPEPALLAQPQEALCADCHDGEGGFAASHQGFSVAGTDCASCHPPHSAASPGLLRASVHADLDCASCHQTGAGEAVKAPDGGSSICLDCHDLPSFTWEGSVHPPAVEGACLDCHDPHTSDHAPLLLAAEQELCGSCHDAVAEAVAGDHGHEIAADCSSCHAGHESEFPNLLASDAQTVCLDCHDDPSASGDDSVLPEGGKWKTHLPAAANCLACHDSHGTGRPAMLVAGEGELCTTCHLDVAADAALAVVHAPVTTGECSGCHLPHSGPAQLLKAQGQELCADCHQNTLAAAAELTQHLPFEDGDCAACHLPHGSEQRALLVAPEAEVCGDCHEVQAAAPLGGSSHPPVLQGDCSACHQPHASNVEPFLNAPQKALCLSCHTELGERLAGGGARKFSRAGGAQVISRAGGAQTKHIHSPVDDLDGCATCHGAHSTRHPALLLEPVVESCLNCHDGDSEDFAAQHLGLPASAMDCGSCHDPHASASAGLLLPVTHLPFEDGDCSACHLEVEEAP